MESNAIVISLSKPLKLIGQCDNCNHGPILYYWSCTSIRNGEKVLLNAATTTTGRHQKNLAMKPGALSDSIGYVFNLTISARGFNQEGIANMRLLANQAPIGGNCSVTPRKVVAFTEQRVTVVCEGWFDPDGSSESQLIYNIWVKKRFFWNTLWYPLSRGPQPSGSFYLSTWDDDKAVMLIVDILDSHGAKTRALKR